MKKSILGIIVIVALAILVLGFYFMSNSQSKITENIIPDNSGTDNANINSSVRVINVNASRWEYSQPEIRVKKGEHVKILINNIDTKHGMIIPDLNVSGIDFVEFTADKEGTYQFRCPTFCGEDHRNMKGTLIVEA